MLKNFKFEGQIQKVDFESTAKVLDSVVCDSYSFSTDSSKDLGIIKVDKGAKTPLQKVLRGDRTIEGYVSGKGRLVVTRSDGSEEVYEVGPNMNKQLSVDIKIGDLMQWQASKDSSLVAYEICYPPYQDGRYENIGE